MIPLVGHVIVLAQEGGGPGLEALAGNLLSNPLSIVLLLIGALLIGVSVLVLGYLTLGAVIEFVVPDVSQGPPPQGR
jgi:MFS superfamily sulfate permease-like transporter